MPIQIEFRHEGRGVLYRCEGVLGLQQIADANNRLLVSPGRIRKLKYAIVDASLMEPQYFSPSEMDDIVLQDRQIASYVSPGFLVAVVAKQSAVFGLARMWQAYIEGIGWEIDIFLSLEGAQSWIRTRVKGKFQLELS
jgi:hypothetical protein